MLEDQHLHDNEELQEIILKDVTTEKKADELFNLDDKLMLSCETQNGFI